MCNSASAHPCYGYAIKAPSFITWAMGPQNTFGWYKTKAAAQERAKELKDAIERESLSRQ
jgi:hypothetical protein